MPPSQHSQYLESKVLAAPSHRLHLMLIEGAIRFGRQAEQSLRRGDHQVAAPALLRLIDIVGEMLTGVRERETDVNKKITELYWFLFRRVSEAKINSDPEKLAEALRLLDYERETWLSVCQKLSAESATAATALSKNTDITSASTPRLSLEA